MKTRLLRACDITGIYKYFFSLKKKKRENKLVKHNGHP